MPEHNKNTSNSLAEISEKYKNCNLLMPVATEVQLNPFYKYTVMEVTADTSDNSGDIWKVGSIKIAEKDGKPIFADVYSPAKPLLMKLAAAAGIQFDPNNTYGTFISKNCYRAKAFGAMRMPDGTGKTHCDEKIINLEDEEDRLRLEFMDKSIQGISEWKAAEAAAKMFKGEWIDTGEKNDKGYPVKKYKIADEDRQKYIERSVLVNMTLLRKTFTEKAMTGAILRVIRALIGLKAQYTKAELQRPFAIPRVTFSPDYNDPEVRKAMLAQGFNSMSNMFGNNRVLPAAPSDNPIILDSFDPDEFADNAAFASSYTEAPEDDLSSDQTNSGSVMSQTHESEDGAPIFGDLECHNCGADISKTVSDFSKNKFGKPLCMKCQKAGGNS